MIVAYSVTKNVKNYLQRRNIFVSILKRLKNNICELIKILLVA